MSRNGIAFAALAIGLSLGRSGALATEPSKGAFPGAFDQPAASEQPSLTRDEQSKLKDELTKARDRQNSQVKAKQAAPAPKAKGH